MGKPVPWNNETQVFYDIESDPESNSDSDVELNNPNIYTSLFWLFCNESVFQFLDSDDDWIEQISSPRNR